MRKWRKAAAMCMAAVMMCSMTACGSGNKESAGTSAAPAETKAEAKSEGSEAVSGESSASAWTPEENVTMIVAYKAGSGTDNTARVLSQYATKYVGKTIVIDNQEGGSGSIGWTALANAKPDEFYMHDPRSVLYLPHRENRLFQNIFPLFFIPLLHIQ